MLLLALDTATSYLTVGVVDLQATDIKELATEYYASPNQHSEMILDLIDKVLEKSETTLKDMAGIVVGLGPGAFTGLRVGITTAATLGHGLKIPACGVNTLAALSRQTPHNEQSTTVIVDAKRKEVFCASFINYKPTNKVQALKHEEIPSFTDTQILVDEASRNLLPHFTKIVKHPLAKDLVETALPDLQNKHCSPLTPIYVREPDAKLPQVKNSASYIREQNNKDAH